MKHKVVDIVCLSLAAAMFGSVALLNLVQPNRPTESAMEQRKLAEMPAFSLKSLADGSFFSGTSVFVSDTFLYRDQLVGLSKKMDTLRGIDYSVGGEEDSFVLLDNATGASAGDDEAANAAADQIAAAFDSLLNQTQTESPAEETPAVPELTAEEEIADEVITEEAVVPAGEITEEPEPEPTPEPEIPAEAVVDIPDENPAEKTPEAPAPEVPAEPAEPAEPEVPAEPEAPAEPVVTAIHLTKNNLKLTVGSGAVVNATVDSNGHSGAKVRWSISDKNVATIAMNPNGGIDVKAVAEGTCTLTCSAGEGDAKIQQKCEITVSAVIAQTPAEDAGLTADFLPDGLFIYGDGVYTQAYYSATNSQNYAQTAAYYKTLFGADTRVSMVIAPVSAMVIDNPTVTSKIPDQKDILDKMAAFVDPSVNFVDAYTEMYEHRDEYLFFKSDHHWTARGAYYAYSAFAKSIGLEPTPLDGFDYNVMNDSYHGSMYNYTYDARVKNFVDTIEAFFPRKAHTMTISAIGGATYNYNTSIVSTNKTYVTFIAGDNPYTVINVPENPQDFNVLVLKDSFGNAFVPFLCEHYGNIIVVDTRHSGMNVYEQLKDYGLSDIIFVNNIQAANSASWYSMYMKAVGVNIGG
ncbi:MAG: Ig-like domain-containing protein [Clostridia bacterium]|nr:Ig-like domain-containing protein [Clostridia bacterium]